MGAEIELLNATIETGEPVADLKVTGGRLKGLEIGAELVARTIDEYPILAIAAALAEGDTVINGVKELRFKESDRISAMSEGLRRLGVDVEEREDGLTIRGRETLRGIKCAALAITGSLCHWPSPGFAPKAGWKLMMPNASLYRSRRSSICSMRFVCHSALLAIVGQVGRK